MPLPTASATLANVRAAARRGDLRRAASLASVISRRPADGRAAMELANVRGGIAFELGRLDDAEDFFEEVIRLATLDGNLILAARATNNLASIAHLRGKASLAASLYRSALSVYRRRQDDCGEAQTEHNLSIVERELDQLDSACRHAAQAVTAARKAGDTGLLALTLMGRAEAHLERGNRRGARRDLRRARALAHSVKDSLSLVEGYRLEALLAFRAERYASALQAASRGYLLARRLGSIHLSGACAELSAQAYRRLERGRLADRFRRRAQDCFRALGAVAALRRLETQVA